MAEIPQGFRKCRVCLIVLPNDCFHKAHKTKPYLRHSCKNCHRADCRSRIKKNVYNKDKTMAAKRRGKARHPDRYKAREVVRGLVQRGRIPSARTLLCVDCLSPADAYDHFLGYAPEHWLKIEPVCRSCHGKRTVKQHEKLWFERFTYISTDSD